MATDYRPEDHFSRRSNTHFNGSYRALLILIAISGLNIFLGFGEIQATGNATGPWFALGIVTALILAPYWYFKTYKDPPWRFVSATDTPPPDLSPPTSGLLRATIQRREATYIVRGTTEIKHELLCWLVLTEAAYQTAKSGNLLDHVLFSVPTPEDINENLKRIGLDPKPPDTYTLARALNDKPLYVMTRDAIELARADTNLREGLTGLNKVLSGVAQQQSSDTFEL